MWSVMRFRWASRIAKAGNALNSPSDISLNRDLAKRQKVVINALDGNAYVERAAHSLEKVWAMGI